MPGLCIPVGARIRAHNPVIVNTESDAPPRPNRATLSGAMRPSCYTVQAANSSARGTASGLLSERGDQVQHAENLGAVADHLAVTGLAPAHDTVLVHDERRAEGDVALRVE